jgi:GNAT superfamily N-acetyltransferase/predicted enzyme related to lactoylglutathione lyase
VLKSSEVIFAVTDVVQTVRFYRDVLGFESEWLWENPPNFGGARWGNVHVMFCLQPDIAGKVEGHMHWFHADDVNGLYERHKAAGAPIVSEIGDKPWGFREYTVRDVNGYHLRFAGNAEYHRPPTATELLPAHIRVEVRMATFDEYAKITASVGWNKDESTMQGALARTIFCVVATDSRDGLAVGMTRVCGDGRNFTIWDVMVMPEYQGQKIGTSMLEAAMAELRRRGPKNAFIGLFTGKPEFYRRLGFRDGGGMSTSI